jgi:head-tail adaptor
MRSGLLTEKIDVYRPTIATNAYGEQTLTPAFLYSTRARLVVHRSSRENVDGASSMPGTITIQVRHYHDIQKNDIVEYNNVQYQVTSVQPLKQEMCQEVTLNTISNDTLTNRDER